MDHGLYLPNRKMRSPYYLPRRVLLPTGNPRLISFAPPAYPAFAAIADLDSAQGTLTFQVPFALITVTGNQIMSDGSTPIGFRVQWTHVHGGVQTLALNKEGINTNILGTGKKPVWVRSVDLFDAGDVLVVEVKSLAKLGTGVTSRIEVDFAGVLLT